ncbi:hypothetical protein K1T71_008429 [Dendrolimus kikuchii]|uniref:Uncharacterized protein n=1 Tax=Dendrolimus kikuchii TaxID=765133 RepID=A0ACC1CXQ4_9NEOP|nr:hypothetical protein K1T71_008429 [Dendrolimus kikuchii]
MKTTVNIETSCRTCMKESVNLVNLFTFVKIDDNCDLELLQVLTECTGTQVSLEDELPKNLCNDCTRLLQVFYTFRIQVARNEEEFKRILEANIKTELEIKPKAEEDIHDVGSQAQTDDYFNFQDDSIDDYLKDEPQMGYICEFCPKTFIKETKFLKHLASHDVINVEAFSCPVCSQSFNTQLLLDEHFTKHLNQHKCEICNLIFGTEQLLLEHTEGHIKAEVEKQEETFQCPDCELSFPKRRSLAMHKKKHKSNKNAGKNVFVCDVCDKSFALKNLLRRHMKLHSNVRPFKCKKCPKRYSRQDQLREHMNKHDGNKTNVCSYCNKAFSQVSGLKEHLRTHTGETPYLCSECGKGFTNSSNLRQHMLRHTGIKAFACNLCPKKFITKGQMTAHVATHTEAHPYRCDKCCATFTKPNSLKKHSLIHLGLRPFGCDTCTMRFTSKDHLKRHQRTHTGEKPYKCQHCDRAFAQSNDLAKHTRVHVGMNIYGCTICDMKFRLMSELKRHYPVHFANGQNPHFQEDQIPNLKSLHNMNIQEELNEKKDGKVKITINSCDKNGVVGDITIDIV